MNIFEVLTLMLFTTMVILAFDYRSTWLYGVNMDSPVRMRAATPSRTFEDVTRDALAACEYNFSDLMEYLIMDPAEGVNQTCTATVLPEVPECGGDTKAFTGVTRNRTAKVAMLVDYGFDVDVLEIALHEYMDVVDKVFITESTRQHYHSEFKPMVLSELLTTPRFKRFQDKVVSLVMDDSYINTDKKDDNWQVETGQEHYRFEAFRRWNDMTGYFGDDDIVGFGDVDEVPSRRNIDRLRRCEWVKPESSIDVGIWFPRESVNWAFRTDFPVTGRFPYSLGDPTFYHMSTVKGSSKVLSRNRGKSPYYLLGGMHMSDAPYLPYTFIKRKTCSECTGYIPDEMCAELRTVFANGKVPALESFMRSFFRTHEQRTRWVPLFRAFPTLVSIPWFLRCNPERFPYWFEKPDGRLSSTQTHND